MKLYYLLMKQYLNGIDLHTGYTSISLHYCIAYSLLAPYFSIETTINELELNFTAKLPDSGVITVRLSEQLRCLQTLYRLIDP